MGVCLCVFSLVFIRHEEECEERTLCSQPPYLVTFEGCGGAGIVLNSFHSADLEWDVKMTLV